MTTVNMSKAKSSLSCLVEAVESGAEREIIIARNGKPAAKLVPIEVASERKRLGAARGKLKVPENIDAHNEGVAKLFGAE